MTRPILYAGVTHACLLERRKRLRNKNKIIEISDLSKKETPSQDASENKERQSISTLAKIQKIAQVKSFKYNKVYLHEYKKENPEQKNRT